MGGLDGLLAKLPPLTMDHTYNGVHYDEWWLLSILLISSIGFAGGSGQRFYSVKDERSARKVGYFAAALGMTGPIMFGIPPLVAKVIWPDLMQVDFFKPYAGNNPQDLVYIGLAMQLLPERPDRGLRGGDAGGHDEHAELGLQYGVVDLRPGHVPGVVPAADP